MFNKADLWKFIFEIFWYGKIFGAVYKGSTAQCTHTAQPGIVWNQSQCCHAPLATVIKSHKACSNYGCQCWRIFQPPLSWVCFDNIKFCKKCVDIEKTFFHKCTLSIKSDVNVSICTFYTIILRVLQQSSSFCFNVSNIWESFSQIICFKVYLKSL